MPWRVHSAFGPRLRPGFRSNSALLLALAGAAAVLPGLPRAAGAASGQARGAQVRSYFQRWRGTPYRWGGTSRSGIDCSAYVRQMYRDLFRVELPRTTKQQIKVGVPIRLDPQQLERGLHPGDAIFYVDRTGIPNHVVSYAGQGLITHSVSGRGVVLEPIGKIYGRRVAARRYLMPPAQGTGAIASLDAPGSDGLEDPIEPLDASEIQDIPCPERYRARADEVRRYAQEPVRPRLATFADRELCEVRALVQALERLGTNDQAQRNAAALDEFARWLEDIDSFGDTLKGGR